MQSLPEYMDDMLIWWYYKKYKILIKNLIKNYIIILKTIKLKYQVLY